MQGSTFYFGADDGTAGNELWSSDGTTVNTNLVADINAGAGSSSPANFSWMGNYIYFSATNGTNGIELWSYQFSNTGINSLSQQISALQIFPNPSNGMMNLNFSSAYDGNFTMDIFSSSGQMTKEEKIHAVAGNNIFSLDLSTCAAGIYFVKISDGRTMRTAKMIVQ